MTAPGPYEELFEHARRAEAHVELHAQAAEYDRVGATVRDGELTLLRLVGGDGREIASARWRGSPDSTALALAETA